MERELAEQWDLCLADVLKRGKGHKPMYIYSKISINGYSE